MQKYVLDTNIFIEAFRDPAANAELQRFHLLFAPFEYMSAVVAQELIAGTRGTPIDGSSNAMCWRSMRDADGL